MSEPCTWDEAIARATAPGGRFELIEEDVRGEHYRVFANAPASLRAIYENARKRGDEIFLVYEDERLSFAETMARVDAIAAMMVERYGVEKGDRVAIAMRNYPEWLLSFMAATSIGAIAVSLNAWWTAEEIEYSLEDSGARLLMADEERAERAWSAAKRLGVRACVVRSEAAQPAGFDHFDAVLEPGKPMPAVDLAPDDDAMILYTSGTTGFPKGAVSTHRAVVSAMMAFACRAQVNLMMKPPREKHPWSTSFILTVPLFHVTGLIGVALACVMAGCKMVMMYRWGAERALELIEREHVTTFVGVPTMSRDLLESPDFERRDTSSLLSVAGGGAPAPPELVKRVDASFKKGRPTIGYGMTETNAYGPQNVGDDYIRKPSSAGRAVPVMQVKVANDDGTEVARGEVGEIMFRGPNLIRGYWGKPEATEETIVDGWLRSGDIGRMDEEGFVFVEDRAKDMVLRGGENVYCAEVEAAIHKYPGVYEVAVFGLPNERLGEEVAAVIHPTAGSEIEVDALTAFLKEHIAGFKVPSVVELSGEPLPRNAAGKFLKRELRERMVAGRS